MPPPSTGSAPISASGLSTRAAMPAGRGDELSPGSSAVPSENLSSQPAPNSVIAAAGIHALTRAARKGDAQAFCRVYDLYSFRLYKFLLMLTRGDENEAREISQAVFIKLARSCKVFEDERRLWTWLCVLAKNTFIDNCRARQRRARFLPLETMPEEPSSPGHAEDRLSEILVSALSALAPADRELLQAAYVDERPLQELADGTGQSYKAIESKLGRLRQKLKEHLLKKLRYENES